MISISLRPTAACAALALAASPLAAQQADEVQIERELREINPEAIAPSVLCIDVRRWMPLERIDNALVTGSTVLVEVRTLILFRVGPVRVWLVHNRRSPQGVRTFDRPPNASRDEVISLGKRHEKAIGALVDEMTTPTRQEAESIAREVIRLMIRDSDTAPTRPASDPV